MQRVGNDAWMKSQGMERSNEERKEEKKGKKDAVRQRSMPNDLLCISPRLLRAKVGNPAFSCLHGQVTFPYDRTDS